MGAPPRRRGRVGGFLGGHPFRSSFPKVSLVALRAEHASLSDRIAKRREDVARERRFATWRKIGVALAALSLLELAAVLEGLARG